MDTQRLTMLLVCHANLCRSPMAERLAVAAFERLPDPVAVQVGSAGTHAQPDRPMHPYAAEVLAEHGCDGADFRSRRLTGQLVAEADLVLTATRAQRTACVQLHPAAVGRTFTLRQFARYVPVLLRADAAAPASGRTVVDELPAARVRAVLAAIADLREQLPVAGEADDLPDPVRLPVQAFRACAAELNQTWSAVAAVIAAGRPADPR
ncbi:MAG TPA: low molecular weight phosphatase family protein [Actinoplanes sp.]|nr:low molecular weight phosphatase family protein [Actinoplanes sp.]